MQELLLLLRAVAGSQAAILLLGETGVGKELMAEFVHSCSPSPEKPLVRVGLAALPRELLVTELVGHVKGAYTHAISQKKGLFELASDGTIFLDDIDDFPLELQSKLLRVLESHEIVRVGGTTPIHVNLRLITASKVDLRAMVERRLFRADLYYRINVIPVFIPPLRERLEDVPPLVEYFAKRFAPDRTLQFSDRALLVMQNYSWPGNVRELRNIVQRLCLLTPGMVRRADLSLEIGDGEPATQIVQNCRMCLNERGMSFSAIVSCLELNLLNYAMERAEGNHTRAAQILQMSSSTFRDKLRKYNLDGQQVEDRTGAGTPQAEAHLDPPYRG